MDNNMNASLKKGEKNQRKGYKNVHESWSRKKMSIA